MISPPEDGPIALRLRADLRCGMRVVPDQEAGLVRIVYAADPEMVYAELAPEMALELALAVIGCMNRLIRPRAP